MAGDQDAVRPRAGQGPALTAEWLTREREAFSNLVEYALTYNQLPFACPPTYEELNLAGHAFLELAGLRYPLLEGKYARVRVEAAAGGGSAHWDTEPPFTDEERRRGWVPSEPSVGARVSWRLAEESAVLREQRSAREERRWARSPRVTHAGVAGAEQDNINPTEARVDFGVALPRTAAWCAEYQVEGCGPVLHHDMRSARGQLHAKAQASNFGVDMRGVFSRRPGARGASTHRDVFN